MAIKSTILGGTDWEDGDILFSEDLLDTINEAIAGGFGLTAKTSASAENNSIFLDSADNVMKKKSNAGVVTTL